MAMSNEDVDRIATLVAEKLRQPVEFHQHYHIPPNQEPSFSPYWPLRVTC